MYLGHAQLCLHNITLMVWHSLLPFCDYTCVHDVCMSQATKWMNAWQSSVISMLIVKKRDLIHMQWNDSAWFKLRKETVCHLPSYVQTDYDVSSESLKNVPKWERWQCCNKPAAVWSSLKWFLIMTEHSVCTLDLVNAKCGDILAVLPTEARFTLNSVVFVPSILPQFLPCHT